MKQFLAGLLVCLFLVAFLPRMIYTLTSIGFLILMVLGIMYLLSGRKGG